MLTFTNEGIDMSDTTCEASDNRWKTCDSLKVNEKQTNVINNIYINSVANHLLSYTLVFIILYWLIKEVDEIIEVVTV